MLSYLDAESEMITFHQGKRMTNIRYLEIFRNKVEVYKHMSGERGTCEARVNGQLIKNGVLLEYATDQ